MFVQIQAYERALRKAFLYLPWERQEQPGCSFVWSSCENAWSPVRGPGGGTLSPECESGPTHRVAGQTVCKPRDSCFLYAGPHNGVRLNMAQKDFYLLVIKIIYTYRNCFH